MGTDEVLIYPKFWMVWNPAKQSPRFIHDTLESAEKEAERLAKENQNQKYIVLEAVNYKLVETEKIKVTTEKYEAIPQKPKIKTPMIVHYLKEDMAIDDARQLIKLLQENIKNAKK